MRDLEAVALEVVGPYRRCLSPLNLEDLLGRIRLDLEAERRATVGACAEKIEGLGSRVPPCPRQEAYREGIADAVLLIRALAPKGA